MANRYNDLKLDIKSLHAEIDVRMAYCKRSFPGAWRGLSHFIIIKILIKMKIYEILIDTGILRGWFNVFKKYWEEVLHGIPLTIHDFHFLRCYYKIAFQDIRLGENVNSKSFSNAWQRPENIYATFKGVYKFALEPTISYGYVKYLKKRDRLLEYGCGLAPITTSLIRYFHFKQFDFSIADIKGFPFHYAKYHLRDLGVKFYDIEPYEPTYFNYKYNAVFLITVMEHLPDPDRVIVNLTEALEKNGLLFFDFILSTGLDLDTKEAVTKRKEILNYIASNYKVIKGKIDFKNDMGLTIVSKL